jgi:curli biogenesis system outer membrane secretion channel CsgG
VTVTGDSKDIALGTGVLKWIGAGPLASGLSMWARTPMDSAIRLCLDKAVDHIVRYSLKKRPQR